MTRRGRYDDEQQEALLDELKEDVEELVEDAERHGRDRRSAKRRRNIRKGRPITGGGQIFMVVIGALVAPGLWLGISTSRPAQAVNDRIDAVQGGVGDTWSSIRYARPSYVPRDGQAAARKALKHLKVSPDAPDTLAEPDGREAQCSYARAETKTLIEHGRAVNQTDHDQLARWIGRCPS